MVLLAGGSTSTQLNTSNQLNTSTQLNTSIHAHARKKQTVCPRTPHAGEDSHFALAANLRGGQQGEFLQELHHALSQRTLQAMPPNTLP